MTARDFDRIENAIANFLAAGLDVADALDKGGQKDAAAQFNHGLAATGDELRTLRQDLRGKVAR